ncbi:MAG: NAD(P)H-dependent oxidoreductase subunit E, partial [Burkholderiaceae bacterium]|nr:NAD(P)H-dependent oxidoreductase subunit E [Burkholderiaceae bacterium]
MTRFARSVGRGKGRQANAEARERVRELIGRDPARADLLVEYLHRIQDAEGGVSVASVAALAAELRLSQAQVFEVASFYHHFDLLPEGRARPP